MPNLDITTMLDMNLNKGLSYREIAKIDGRSHSRISQILGPQKKRPDQKRLRKLYAHLRKEFQTNQRYPSHQEVVEAGYASCRSMVRYYYDQMIRLGWMERDAGIARGIRLLPLKDETA